MARIPADSEDMYSDASPNAAAEPSGETDQGGGGPSATIPKSLLAGKEFKVGDSVILKIDAIHDDEVVVSYDYEAAGGEGEGESSPEGEAPAMMGGGSDMEGMMS